MPQKPLLSIKRWYDGYHFGEFDVYCPWDVINYLRDLQRNPHILPAGYWKNTSDNAIIRSFIDHSGPAITQKLETLLSGGYILQSIDENLTYDYLHSSEENLWSILYLTGYLTKLPASALASPLPQDIFALTIPNAEIQEIFETTILKWFQDSAKTWNKTALLDAVWNADPQKLTLEMTSLLRRTISYHDYHEDFYHAFLAGIFTGAGYVVDSNKEHGEGRSDIVVYDPLNSRVAVFEVKCSKTLKIWNLTARKPFSKSRIVSIPAALQMITTRSFVMAFPSFGSGAWLLQKLKHSHFSLQFLHSKRASIQHFGAFWKPF